MGQKAKNAGMKKRSPKKEAIDRLSKQNNNVMIHTANYDVIRELTGIIYFGKPKARMLNSQDKHAIIVDKMTSIIDGKDTESLSKIW